MPIRLRLSGLGQDQFCPVMILLPAFLCNPVNRGNEPVTLAGDGLHETRPLWVIAKDIADLADGSIDAVLGVEKDPLAPETVYDFLSRYQMPLFLEEKDE